MTATPNNTPDTPIRPTEILDPYPERPTHLRGVRPHTQHGHHLDRKVSDHVDTVGPFPFAAILPTTISVRSRRQRFPWESTILYTFGQLVLAVAIDAGHVGPGFGALVCVAWLCCGALLIAAQVLSTDHGQADHNPQRTRALRSVPMRCVARVLRLALTRRAEAVGASGAASRKAAGCAEGAGKPLGNTRKLLLLPDTEQEAGQW